jgi:antitoxin MazE
MRVSIRKRGGAATVKIPSALMQAAALEIGQIVVIKEKYGRIIIEQTCPAQYELSVMIARITPDNLHLETDFAEPVGGEWW